MTERPPDDLNKRLSQNLLIYRPNTGRQEMHPEDHRERYITTTMPHVITLPYIITVPCITPVPYITPIYRGRDVHVRYVQLIYPTTTLTIFNLPWL